jgi:WS/DGAT/MGAT family acyltransferase
MGWTEQTEAKVLKQVKAQDAAFLYMETDNILTHVSGIGIYDPSTAPEGTVRFKDIIAHVESRLHTSPVFRQKLVHVPLELDYPYWVDDEYFDIEYHIRHARLPAPGDWRQFCIHVARYHSRPLDMNRPPWEMYVIEGLDDVTGVPKGSYAIVTKIHHVAADGTSAMRFFAALADIDAQGTPAVDVPIPESPACKEPDLPAMLRRAFVNNVTSPVRMVNTMMRSAPAVVNLVRNALDSRQEDRSVPDTRFNREVSSHRMFDAVSFDLAKLRQIRRLAENSTINDVVLAICAGGLRRYLEFHDELPKKPLVAWVPINARRGSGADESGNNIAAMTASIHTDVADPVERLKAIARTTRETKEARSGVSARIMTDLSQHVPSATQLLAGRLVTHMSMGRRMCNLFISNVPGPQVPLYMNGAELIASFGMAPLNNGLGLFIATPSYNGKITFCITSTREIMPDVTYLVECIAKSFDELLAAGDGTAGKKVKKKSKKKARAARKPVAAEK